MTNLHEIALLVAVAIPVAAVLGLNIFAALGGEEGTLLLPVPHPFASIVLAEEPVAEEHAMEPQPECEPEPLRKAA